MAYTAIVNTTDWSSVGFADDAELRTTAQGLNVLAGLDQSAHDIDVLDIEPNARGRIGSGAQSLVFDASDAGGALNRCTNYGQVELWLSAAGGEHGLIDAFCCASGSTNYLTGGDFGTVSVAGGVLNVSNGCDISVELNAVSGSGTIEYDATTLPVANIAGGTWTIKRLVTTLNIEGPATVILDNSTGATAATTVNLRGGGRLILKAGNIGTLNSYRGTVDSTKADEDITITTNNDYNGVAFVGGKTGGFLTITTDTPRAGFRKIVTPTGGAPEPE